MGDHHRQSAALSVPIDTGRRLLTAAAFQGAYSGCW